MERETLKVSVLSGESTSPDLPQADRDLLDSVTVLITRSANSSTSANDAQSAENEVLAALDKNGVWDAKTRSRQYSLFVAATAGKRQRLLSVYRSFEPQFLDLVQKSKTLDEQKTKAMIKIIAPDAK
jgi:hypothetical protein